MLYYYLLRTYNRYTLSIRQLAYVFYYHPTYVLFMNNLTQYLEYFIIQIHCQHKYCWRKYLKNYVWLNICLTTIEGLFLNFCYCTGSDLCHEMVLELLNLEDYCAGEVNVHMDCCLTVVVILLITQAIQICIWIVLQCHLFFK